MIPIEKPDDEPDRLQSAGTDERANLENAHEDENTDFAAFLSERGFNRTIFSHDSVRERLLDCQHKKCCYCEKGQEHMHEVEHFRPKKAVRQDRDEPLQRPGYYWLAYEWKNLLMACPHCNSRKGAVFPIRNPDNRVRSHQDSVEKESPILIRPDQENPTDHLTFREHIVVGETERGQKTVETIGLNREQLKWDRREYYELLEVLHDLTQLDSEKSEDAEEILEDAMADDAKFSAMATVAIETGFDVT